VFVPSDRQIPRATTDGEPIVVASERSEAARAFYSLAGLYLQHERVTDDAARNGNGSNGDAGSGKRRRRKLWARS
jgi:MinD-like ATPase involved in chromosome partitioning or flagellar assembly